VSSSFWSAMEPAGAWYLKLMSKTRARIFEIIGVLLLLKFQFFNAVAHSNQQKEKLNTKFIFISFAFGNVLGW